MNNKDAARAQALDDILVRFSQNVRALPGIHSAASRQAFVTQLIESLRRVEYVRLIASRDISSKRADVSSALFDPLKAAIHLSRNGYVDEAMWLVFLATHFGKSKSFGWMRVHAVYGRLGHADTWTWARTSADPAAFRNWLNTHRNSIPGRFGNHRKYESLDAISTAGTGQVVETYVGWVTAAGGHASLLADAIAQSGGDPAAAFDWLFASMSCVARFGRTARFDYLTMIAKLGIAAIEPGIPYMTAATGPRRGANLLFAGSTTATKAARDLDLWTQELGHVLNVGMQEMEDALCNWQKSPDLFISFRG